MKVYSLGSLDVLGAAHALSDLPQFVFLDSASRHAVLGRYSFVAADPFGTFTVDDGVAFWNGEAFAGHPVPALKSLLARFGQSTLPGLPPFQGGAAGFFGYEFGRVLEKLPSAVTEMRCPDAVLHFFDAVLAFDHVANRGWLISTGWPGPAEQDRARRAGERAEFFLDRLVMPSPPDRRSAPVSDWSSNFTKESYAEAVRKVIDYIRAGDIFQANIAQRFTASLPAEFDTLAFYRTLRAINPATFGALLKFDDLTIASSSPERFFTVRAGQVESRPIKGTARRSDDPITDRALAKQLRASEKDRAENVMIVDLLRNDLSRVCRAHSVQVPVLCDLESYAAVHHLVSVVRGELAAGQTAVDLLAACFPGGSITGAPKIRAMQIITEIEQYARQVYCGSIGYFGFDGSADQNIAIRTVMFRDRKAVFQAGGGVTILSDPLAEYEETLIKAQRIFAAFGPHQLR